MKNETAWPGHPRPLGVRWDGAGVNVAVFSESAEAVDVCFYGPRRRTAGSIRRPSGASPLAERTGSVWHGYVPGVGPGTALRPTRRRPVPARAGSRRHNSQQAAARPVRPAASPAASRTTRPCTATSVTRAAARHDHRDSAPYVPRRRWSPTDDLPVGSTTTARMCRGRRPCRLRAAREGLHPAAPWPCRRSCAARTPDSPTPRRSSTCSASASPPSSCCRCSPSSQRAAPARQRGLTNYWGYNTIGYFAPHAAYASAGDDPVSEFRAMVRSLHEAGLEVILDVVYNHTAEGAEDGPTLSFRGLDNATTTGSTRATPPATRTPPAAATRSTLGRGAGVLAAGAGLAALLGRSRCTSTASASTSPALALDARQRVPRSPSARTRCCARSS